MQRREAVVESAKRREIEFPIGREFVAQLGERRQNDSTHVGLSKRATTPVRVAVGDSGGDRTPGSRRRVALAKLPRQIDFTIAVKRFLKKIKN